MRILSFTTEQFEQHIALLRKHGNVRLPYCILLDTDGFAGIQGGKECGLDSKLQPKVLRLPTSLYYTQQDAEYPIADAIELDKLADELACDELLCIVTGHIADIEYSPLATMFNEIHTERTIDSNQFKLQKSYMSKSWACDETTTFNVYLRAIMDNPQIIAIPSSMLAQQLQIPGFEPWKPWLTLFLHKQTLEAIQVVWDTREIIGYAHLTEEQAKRVLSFGNANDNCNLLYSRVNMPAESAFMSYVIAQVPTN